MITSLFFKECKAILKSIIYVVFIGVVVLFYVSQLADYAGDHIRQYAKQRVFNPLTKPTPNAKTYGTKNVEIADQVISKTTYMLDEEYKNNNYTTYPIGFYKIVKLNSNEQERIKQILTDIKDINDYEKFIKYMTEVDFMLGGGSKYAPHTMKNYSQVPITYEEKLAEYNAFIAEDKITGAYARLFCDYMGIVIGLFAIFVPVSFSMRDRMSNINELVYSREIKSSKLIISRYFALVTMILLPFLLLSLIPTTQLVTFAIENSLPVDMFAFVKYIVGWLLPSILTVTAVGLFITILTDTPIAIIVQFLYSFLGMFTSLRHIDGGSYGYEIVIRHNSISNLQAYKDGMLLLIINRVSYTIIAFIIVIVTIIIYELKRKGEIDFFGSLQKIYRKIRRVQYKN